MKNIKDIKAGWNFLFPGRGLTKMETVSHDLSMSLGPDDRILLSCEGRLTDEQVERLNMAINLWIDGSKKVLILEKGLKLSIVRITKDSDSPQQDPPLVSLKDVTKP
jgi:hypothetical protein